MAESRCVLLYTKPAEPGRVKTRLIGELTPAEAADLHAAFLDDLMERLQRGDFALRVAWALDEAAAMPAGPVPGLRQHGADLGERLFRGLEDAAREHQLVAAVGSDHPDLPVERVEEAFERLEEGADVVLGPAEDGGYYLVALGRRGLRREIFTDVPWSTSRVLATTLARCGSLGVEVALLAEGSDVDTPSDLERLAARLATEEVLCPRTRTLLQAWGRIAAPV